jgi:hypothetical protein
MKLDQAFRKRDSSRQRHRNEMKILQRYRFDGRAGFGAEILQRRELRWLSPLKVQTLEITARE